MIMGHIGFGSKFDYFIHAFHMPMFFLVSGMFFKVKRDGNFLNYMRRKAKSLLIPYAVFGVFHYAVWQYWNRPTLNIAPLKRLCFQNTDGLPIAGALWFLTALFFSVLLYYLIRYYIYSEVLQLIVIIAIAGFGCTAAKTLPARLPYALDAACVGVGLMHIGYLFYHDKNSKRIQDLFHLRYHEWMILGVITTVLIFKNGYINMRVGMYEKIPNFWINVVLAVIVGINFSKYVWRLAPDKICSFLVSVGKDSMLYVCLNQLAILYVGKAVAWTGIQGRVSKFMILFLTIGILYVINQLLMKTKLKIVLGK